MTFMTRSWTLQNTVTRQNVSTLLIHRPAALHLTPTALFSTSPSISASAYHLAHHLPRVLPQPLKPKPAYIAGYGQRLHFEVAGRIGSLWRIIEGALQASGRAGSRQVKDANVSFVGASAPIVTGTTFIFVGEPY
jgi:hypothetical protein